MPKGTYDASDFNPLPSCEGRLNSVLPRITRCAFQSTPLMRGETGEPDDSPPRGRNFNPLPSCEGRQAAWPDGVSGGGISIHSPHARGDDFALVQAQILAISIHSPHARGDQAAPTPARRAFNFNPLPSCEGRRAVLIPIFACFLFQSTPLMRVQWYEVK